MTAPASTRKVYFAARAGKVTTWGTDAPLPEVRAYVGRNNTAAARRGDTSKPYAVLAYTIPAEEQP